MDAVFARRNGGVRGQELREARGRALASASASMALPPETLVASVFGIMTTIMAQGASGVVVDSKRSSPSSKQLLCVFLALPRFVFSLSHPRLTWPGPKRRLLIRVGSEKSEGWIDPLVLPRCYQVRSNSERSGDIESG
jgi:hypothetical protein